MTHVVFFNWADLEIDHPELLARQPFNRSNPDGALELCTCSKCGTPILLDDKQRRVRVAVPNLMGYAASFPVATYHAFYDNTRGYPKPDDGRPVYESFRPDFAMPQPA